LSGNVGLKLKHTGGSFIVKKRGKRKRRKRKRRENFEKAVLIQKEGKKQQVSNISSSRTFKRLNQWIKFRTG